MGAKPAACSRQFAFVRAQPRPRNKKKRGNLSRLQTNPAQCRIFGALKVLPAPVPRTLTRLLELSRCSARVRRQYFARRPPPPDELDINGRRDGSILEGVRTRLHAAESARTFRIRVRLAQLRISGVLEMRSALLLQIELPTRSGCRDNSRVDHQLSLGPTKIGAEPGPCSHLFTLGRTSPHAAKSAQNENLPGKSSPSLRPILRNYTLWASWKCCQLTPRKFRLDLENRAAAPQGHTERTWHVDQLLHMDSTKMGAETEPFSDTLALFRAEPNPRKTKNFPNVSFPPSAQYRAKSRRRDFTPIPVPKGAASPRATYFDSTGILRLPFHADLAAGFRASIASS